MTKVAPADLSVCMGLENERKYLIHSAIYETNTEI